MSPTKTASSSRITAEIRASSRFASDVLRFGGMPSSGYKRIFSMWLACHTQQEIADAVGTPRKTVDDVLKTFGENGSIANLAKPDQSAAEHATDFETPIYNIWKQQAKTNPGRIAS